MAIRRQVNLSYLDKAESTSVVGFYVSEASLDAENATGVGLVSALASAVNAVSLSNLTGRSTSVNRDSSATIPTNDAAYNGNKLTVYVKDSTTEDKYQITIPAVNPGAYNTATGTRNVLLTVAEGGTTQIEDLITAIEDGAISKDGNALLVLKIKKSSAKQGG